MKIDISSLLVAYFYQDTNTSKICLVTLSQEILKISLKMGNMVYQYITVVIVGLILVKNSYQQCSRTIQDSYYYHITITCSNINQSSIYMERNKITGQRVNEHSRGEHRSHLFIDDSIVHVLPSNFSDRFDFSTIHLEGIWINRITPGAFSSQKHLQELHLKNNRLKKIINGVFTIPTLELLDLQHNELEEIEDNPFAGLSSLRKLLLGYNNLTKLSDHLFDSMVRLEYLDISHNSIRMLDNTVFSKNMDLKVLYINNNNLFNIPENIFINNKNLSSIDLSYNPIKHVTYNIFLYLDDLKHINVLFSVKSSVLHLDKADIDSIATKLMSDKEKYNIFSNPNNKTNNLISANLSDTNLSYINDTIFKGCAFLIYLNLSSNNIDDVDKTAFLDLVSLKSLDLSHNRMQFLPHGLFSNLFDLEYLNISFNAIQHLSYGLFDSLRSLTFLDISSNQISSFPPYILHSLGILTEFRIDNNNIEYIDGDEMTSQLKSLKIISLDNNLWSCSKLSKLVHILENRSVKVSHRNNSYSDNVNKIKCNDMPILVNYNNNSNTINYSDMKENIDNMFSSINSNFYSSSFYTFFNKDFKDTEFYIFFKNGKYQIQTKPEAINANANNANSIIDRPVPYKLVGNEEPEKNSYIRLEIISYLLCITLLLNFSFSVYIVYTFLNKKRFKRKAVNSDAVFDCNRELV